MQEIDARGLSCPAPVLQTRAMLEAEAPNHLKVVVDNAAAQQNVQRFLEFQGFQTTLEKEGENYAVIGKRSPASGNPPVASSELEAGSKKIMVMCATDRMGNGDDVLGLKLMINFLHTLKEMGSELWRLVFVNNGVKLTIDHSDALEDLRELEKAGLMILVCGTCLTHFGLLERKQVGVTTNMLDIVTAMQLADKVINL